MKNMLMAGVGVLTCGLSAAHGQVPALGGGASARMPEGCVTFTSADAFTLSAQKKRWDGTIEWSANGADWTVWEGSALEASEAGGVWRIQVRGGADNTVVSGGSAGKWILTPAGTDGIACSGNLESLRGATGGGPSPTPMADHCYNGLFQGCKALTSAPTLPATGLSRNCYFRMFNGCSALRAAPALPATELATNCYYMMFYGCASLASAPELPALRMVNGCYLGMFMNCTALAEAPELPARDLAMLCYSCMFQGCTALECAPVLPATKLYGSCYAQMFQGCTSLKIPALLNHVTDFGGSERSGACYNMYCQCSALAVKDSRTGEYTCAWRISSGAAFEVGNVYNMFYLTDGRPTMNDGTPSRGTTYYVPEQPLPAYLQDLDLQESERAALKASYDGWVAQFGTHDIAGRHKDAFLLNVAVANEAAAREAFRITSVSLTGGKIRLGMPEPLPPSTTFIGKLKAQYAAGVPTQEADWVDFDPETAVLPESAGGVFFRVLLK